jgi:hypothetical protein
MSSVASPGSAQALAGDSAHLAELNLLSRLLLVDRDGVPVISDPQRRVESADRGRRQSGKHALPARCRSCVTQISPRVTSCAMP